jgi:hypothetical protein
MSAMPMRKEDRVPSWFSMAVLPRELDLMSSSVYIPVPRYIRRWYDHLRCALEFSSRT